jgi:hypothetical protein
VEKVDIQQLSDRLTYEDNKGKSDVSEFFKIVKVDNVMVQFVKCDKCNTLDR